MPFGVRAGHVTGPGRDPGAGALLARGDSTRVRAERRRDHGWSVASALEPVAITSIVFATSGTSGSNGLPSGHRLTGPSAGVGARPGLVVATFGAVFDPGFVYFSE